jgi:hypothetical protein
VNVGIVCGLTVTLIVVIVAQIGKEVDVGVKIYVALPTVDVDIGEFHVPATLLFDRVDKVAGITFLQYGPT